MTPLYLTSASWVATILLAFALTASAQRANIKIDPASLRAVPEGHYLVTLELGGQTKKLNLKVEGNRATCVNSSDPALRNLKGEFQLHANGMFVGRFQGANDFRATQLWIIRPDGIAAVREVPDRGEIQSAIPVKDDSLTSPGSP